MTAGLSRQMIPYRFSFLGGSLTELCSNAKAARREDFALGSEMELKP